jgi:hypothetical protein
MKEMSLDWDKISRPFQDMKQSRGGKNLVTRVTNNIDFLLKTRRHAEVRIMKVQGDKSLCAADDDDTESYK